MIKELNFDTMEKKQLNFSAPLMSARRYSSPLRSSGEDNRLNCPSEDQKAIHYQQSDLNMGEVVKPGSVPFMWEQIPGKAKGGNESRVTSPPKLPPGRNSDLMPFPPGKKSGELNVNGFRTPNKLSGELVVLRQRNRLSGELNVLRPQNKFSGELNTLRSHRFSGEIHTLRPHNKLSGELNTLNKLSSLNDEMDRWEEMSASSESGNDDATFSDALDTFSQLESFSVNCSVSGLSGSEHPEKKAPGIITTDAKARDFMMDRFLPAAKAMTLEPSQYASRKQIVVVDQSKESKALAPRASTPPSSRNVCHIVPYTGQDIGSEESEEEEEGYDEQSAISVKIKACGFLPWFCSKNSLRLLNPLPSMKHRSKISASKVSHFVKTGSLKSPSQKLAKNVPSSNHKHKVDPGYKSCELQKPKHTSRPMFYSGELQTRSGSPYRSSRRSSPSRYRNDSSPHLYQKGVGFLAVPKRVDPYDENGSKSARNDSKRLEELRRNTRLSGTRSPVVEKTLYIDSVNITKVSHSILNLPKTKRQVDASGNELGAPSISGSVQEAVKSETSMQDGARLEILKARGMSRPCVSGSLETGVGRKSKFSEASKMSANGNANTCRELVLVADDPAAMQSPFTPPLPKSPSESWLSRNLPSVSPRNSVSYSSLNSKLQSRKHNAKTPTSVAKWETIVKSSHLRHDHGRYSEELVTHVPQRLRTWK